MGSVHRIDRPKPWIAKYRGPDGRQHSRSFHRKVDAERWIRDEESKMDRAAWVDPRGGAIPFADYAETWLDGLYELKPKTINEYRWHLGSRVLPTFGDKRLRSINGATIRGWQNQLLGNGLSAGTVRQSRGVLSLILSQAVNDGLLVRNPCEKVKPPTVRPRRQLFLTADQLSALADECGDYGPFVWFLGWSGLRLGEAVALRAGRVDAGRRRVRVEESATEIRGQLVFSSPKTHESRTVLVPRFVMDRIEPLLVDKGREDFVFSAPRGGPVRANNFRGRVFNPAVERMGMPDLVPHDLRDTSASLAISAGASIKAIQQMLGHASAKVTLDIYGGLFEEDLEMLADKLEERYG